MSAPKPSDLVENIRTSEEDASLLIMILDTNWADWRTPHPSADLLLSVQAVLEHSLVFLNTYLGCSSQNHLAVIGTGARSRFLYTSTDPPSSDEEETKTSQYTPLSRMSDILIKNVLSMMTNEEPVSGTAPNIAGALSLALCYANRLTKQNSVSLKPRILVVGATQDRSLHYVPIMNCIFSSQKMGIPIDVAQLSDADSIFLQQAAYITHGIYLRMTDKHDLLRNLLMVFLVDRHSRKFLSLPCADDVDFRGSCFCHKKLVDIANVCSTCLSVYCEQTTACTSCRTPA